MTEHTQKDGIVPSRAFDFPTHFLYRATLEERHWHALEQDREMLESMPA